MQNSAVRPPGAEPFSAAAYDPSVEPPGLGVRTIGSDAVSGELLDVLRVTPDLGRPAVVEMAVRERATRFAQADLRGLAPIVRVERGTADRRLEVWSRRADGFRLSAVLEWLEVRQTPPSLDAALTVGDRLLAAMISLQQVETQLGASGHGAIAVDQITVSEAGEITLTDYAFGPALAALQWPRERLWRRFRIAMPPAAGLARFDHRVDVTQAAVVITALLAGRPFDASEYPRDLELLVAEAVRRSTAEAGREDRERLSAWLRAATELDPRAAFNSAASARVALRAVLGHRLGQDAAVRQWLRAARGLSDLPVETPLNPPPATPVSLEEPEPKISEAPTQADSPPPAPRVGWLARLRRRLNAG